MCLRGVCVFVKLHITTQSSPATLVDLCYLHWSSQEGINDTDYESLCVCLCVYLFKFHITHRAIQPYCPGHYMQLASACLCSAHRDYFHGNNSIAVNFRVLSTPSSAVLLCVLSGSMGKPKYALRCDGVWMRLTHRKRERTGVVKFCFSICRSSRSACLFACLCVYLTTRACLSDNRLAPAAQSVVDKPKGLTTVRSDVLLPCSELPAQL